jgi:hypothetical protein
VLLAALVGVSALVTEYPHSTHDKTWMMPADSENPLAAETFWAPDIRTFQVDCVSSLAGLALSAVLILYRNN